MACHILDGEFAGKAGMIENVGVSKIDVRLSDGSVVSVPGWNSIDVAGA